MKLIELTKLIKFIELIYQNAFVGLRVMRG